MIGLSKGWKKMNAELLLRTTERSSKNMTAGPEKASTKHSKIFELNGDFKLPAKPFSFEDDKLFLFWIPELKNVIGRYFNFFEDNNFSVSLDARDHLHVSLSNGVMYDLAWGGNEYQGKPTFVENISFFNSSENYNNMEGPSILQNKLTYQAITPSEGRHVSSGFRSQADFQWFHIDGISLSNEHAAWLKNHIDIPWTAENPLTEKVYALFLLKFKNK